MYTHIHIYACLCMIYTYPLSTDRVSLSNILNKMAAIQQVLQFVCIHTNIHTRTYICIHIYIYQYDAINDFLQVIITKQSYLLTEWLQMPLAARMFYKASKQFIASILSFSIFIHLVGIIFLLTSIFNMSPKDTKLCISLQSLEPKST